MLSEYTASPVWTDKMKNYLVKAKESSPFLLIQKRHTSKSDSYSRIQFPDVCEESWMEISCTCPLVAAVKQRYRPLFNSSHDTKKGCESQVVARNARSDKSEPAIVIATQNYQRRNISLFWHHWSSTDRDTVDFKFPALIFQRNLSAY